MRYGKIGQSCGNSMRAGHNIHNKHIKHVMRKQIERTLVRNNIRNGNERSKIHHRHIKLFLSHSGRECWGFYLALCASTDYYACVAGCVWNWEINYRYGIIMNMNMHLLFFCIYVINIINNKYSIHTLLYWINKI